MTSVTIRFEGGNVDLQSHGPVSRIVGFVSARSLIPLFDIADLAANPRVAKVGDVTDSIRESIVASPTIFPFLTKGVLIGTTSYESLERNRYRLNFENPDYEGIMDGGHNMLDRGPKNGTRDQSFWISHSLSESTRQITPPIRSGHAPPSQESRKSCQSVHPGKVLTW